MVQLRAVHREPVEEEILAGEATQFLGRVTGRVSGRGHR